MQKTMKHQLSQNKKSNIKQEKVLNIDDIDIVLYHAWCPDGFGSAFVIWYYYCQKYGRARADSLLYYGCVYDENPFNTKTIDVYTDKNIIICDFSFNYEKTLFLLNICKSLLIVDHHETAKNNLVNLSHHYKNICMTKSGVGLTWDLFFPNKPMPMFMEYLQDHDLWTELYTETLYFNAWLTDKKFNFDEWEKYMNDEYLNECVAIGKPQYEYKMSLVNMIVNMSKYIIQCINDKYYIIGYCNTCILKSEVGNKMFDKYPFLDFACVWNYNLHAKVTQISLRSTNTRTSVETIANQLGGGGHRNASGIKLKDCQPILPYKEISDPELISSIFKNESYDIKLSKLKLACTQIKITCLEKFMSYQYKDLLKRVFSKSNLIVFETIDTSNVTLSEDMKSIIQLKTYTVVWNEQSINDMAHQLYQAVCINGDVMTFSSDREFKDMFSELTSGVESEIEFKIEPEIGSKLEPEEIQPHIETDTKYLV